MIEHTPLYLYNFLNEKYQNDWLEFEPEIIKEIELENGNTIGEISENLNKVFALQTAINTQLDKEGFLFNHWQIFEKIILSLNGVVPNFKEVEQAEPHEIHGGLNILKKINNNIEFGEQVISYISASYKHESIVYCPFYSEVNELLEETPLKKEVQRTWKILPKIKDEKTVDKIANLKNDARTIQIKKLTFIQEYTKALVNENNEEEKRR